jgi:hypothetical protein
MSEPKCKSYGKPSEKNYVLATKYENGSPKDQWCIGFVSGMTNYSTPRYNVVDNDGNLVSGNGFRRVEHITREEGQYILDNKETIERCQQSLWWHLEQARVKLEEKASDNTTRGSK